MAAFDNFRDMSDIALKPQLLRTLIKEHVPDEKRPFRNPSELLHVVSLIKTHRLLSECFVESMDQKLVQNWNSAVDSWVDRLLVLVSGNMSDKCWAGISLIGVTCEECQSDRFLASYSVWFNKLLPHIQHPPIDSPFVKFASCISLSDLFTRLSQFSNLRKDGSAHAGKVVQPVLKLLNGDNSEAVWEGAINLLSTVLAFFPSSVLRHCESVEAAIVSKIKSSKCSESMLKKLAHCLALLPRSKGDENSWSLMMQKILFLINIHLNDSFQGIEEEAKRKEAMRLLAPPGKDPLPPLGGFTTSGEILDDTTNKYEPVSISSVSTLMLCCSMMLTSHHSVQVAFLVRPLLALVERVLLVDGSVSQSMFSYMTAIQQQLICSQLPILHMHGLDLLASIIKALRSQILPHSSEIVRLLTEYFKRCVFSEGRIKVYSIMKILLLSMGVGIAVYLAPELINQASLDLTNDEKNGSLDSTEAALLQPSHKKRKQNVVAKVHEKQHETIGFENRALKSNVASTPNSVKIAALEALEALLTVGGASKSESWRLNLDLLLMNVAKKACGYKSSFTDFQLASLRALLASFLSRARICPPFLAQGLELFRRGKQETGTQVSEFCGHALLALEVLIHPRVRSLNDFASSDEIDHRLSNNLYSSGQKRTLSFSNDTHEMNHVGQDSDEDDLYRNWIEKEDDVAVSLEPSASPVEKVDKIMVDAQQLVEAVSRDTVAVAVRAFDRAVEIEKVALNLNEILPEKGAMGNSDIEKVSNSEYSKIMEVLDHESSMDSFPDIIDADPDSD